MADPSIEDILDEATPVTRTVHILTKGDLGAELDRLEAELRRVLAEDEKQGSIEGSERAKTLAREIADVQDQAQGFMRPFTFADIGDYAWSNLRVQHPPTDAQRRVLYDHNPDTFHPAAIAASCINPTMTVKQAEKLRERFSSGRWQQLWDTCLSVNRGVGELPKSVTASVVLNGSGPRSKPLSD